MARWIAGVDLGQAHDPTALVIIDRHREHLDVVHAERLALGTPYATQVDHIAALIADLGTPPRLSRARRRLHDRGRCHGLRPALWSNRHGRRISACYAVTITAGASSNTQGVRWTVTKADLIGAVQVALQNHALRIAANMAETKALVSELKGYHKELSAGGVTYANDPRFAPHDDLVIAAALAVFTAGRIGYEVPDPYASNRPSTSTPTDQPRFTLCVHGDRVIQPGDHPEGTKIVVGPDLIPRRVRKSWPN